MEANKLIKMYTETFQPALKEGEYVVKMTDQTIVDNTHIKKASYVKFTFEVLEGENAGRIITENRFERGLGVMISHLRRQLDRADEAVVPQKFCAELIANATPIHIWVVKRTFNGLQKTNINFLEPIAEIKPNTDVVDDSQEPATAEANN